MSVVRIKDEAESTGAVSGSGMDRVIEKRTLPKTIRYAIGGALALALLSVIYVATPDGQSQSVSAARITVSTVTDGRFEDTLPVRARVTPLVSVYLDAIEGGRVEKVLVEDGATVEKGQLLAVLSNAELQLSVLARQTEVTQQLNSMRALELQLSQTRFQNDRALLESELALRKAQRQYEREAPLAVKGFVAGKTFKDTTDELAFQKDRHGVVARTRHTDEQLQTNQLAQLREAAASLESSLALARASLDALNIRAPDSGLAIDGTRRTTRADRQRRPQQARRDGR